MPASKPIALPFAALVAAFSAALGFMSGLAIYGARVAVLEAQQTNFVTEVRDIRGELALMRSDIQALTIRLPKVASADTVKALRPQPVGLVSSLPDGSGKPNGSRQAASGVLESCWCDTRRGGRKRHAKGCHKRRRQVKVMRRAA